MATKSISVRLLYVKNETESLLSWIKDFRLKNEFLLKLAGFLVLEIFDEFPSLENFKEFPLLDKFDECQRIENFEGFHPSEI